MGEEYQVAGNHAGTVMYEIFSLQKKGSQHPVFLVFQNMTLMIWSMIQTVFQTNNV